MALYLGNSRVKINLDGVVYCLNLYSKTPITNGIRLVTSDGLILKDANRLFITTYSDVCLLSLDEYILQDSDGLDLIPNDCY